MDINDLENRIIELETWLGQQLGYKQNHKGYVGRVLRELFNFQQKTTKTMDGDDNQMGMRTKVAIIWKTYMVLWGALCGVIGYVGKDLIGRFF